MDRYLNLSDTESRALLDGASVVLVPMRPQPDHKPFQVQGEATGDWFTENRDYPERGPMMAQRWKPPFVPGDILNGREAWAENCDEYGTEVIQYRAGGYLIHGATGSRHNGTWRDETFPGECGLISQPERWCSAQHMPAWAIRHRYPITSVSPVKLAEIGEEMATKAGFDTHGWGLTVAPGGELPCVHLLHKFWDSRHPKYPFQTSWAWAVELDRKEKP